MSVNHLVSLTTDYGLADGFVAACHGVIATRAPSARILDVTHLVPRGDIRKAAVVLAQTVPYLPVGVHMAVVDPGVGTTRRPVAIETDRGFLVGPDNGLLWWAAESLSGARLAVVLNNPRHHLHPLSHTFHGRDIFAPVSADLSKGAALSDVGDPIGVTELVRLPEPVCEATDTALRSEVLSVDNFGNLQLCAAGELLESMGEDFDIAGHHAVRGDMFAAAAHGELVVLVDSADKIAVAVNGGSAAELLKVGPGEVLTLRSP